MDGHGVAVGGCIVDSGKFDWTKYPDKFPGLCTPDDSYHGITYAERFGKTGAFVEKYFAKGDGIEIIGRMESDKYTDKENKTRTTWGVSVDEVYFPLGKGKADRTEETPSEQSNADLPWE